MTIRVTPEALEAFVQRSISNLSTDLRQRRSDLEVLLAILPARYPHRQDLAMLLETLRAHDRAQLDLALKFQTGGKP